MDPHDDRPVGLVRNAPRPSYVARIVLDRLVGVTRRVGSHAVQAFELRLVKRWRSSRKSSCPINKTQQRFTH